MRTENLLTETSLDVFSIEKRFMTFVNICFVILNQGQMTESTPLLETVFWRCQDFLISPDLLCTNSPLQGGYFSTKLGERIFSYSNPGWLNLAMNWFIKTLSRSLVWDCEKLNWIQKKLYYYTWEFYGFFIS